MSGTLRQLLAAFTTDAARLALAADQFAGQRHDPQQFAHTYRSQMLQIIVRLPQLRTELAERYRDELADAHPTLQALVGTDEAQASTAAAVLADPGQLKRLARERPHAATPRSTAAASSAERAAKRADQRLAKLRADRERARAQRDQAQAEARVARQQLAEALDDRDEALAIVEAVRSELEAERHEAAALAHDAVAAASLLAAAVEVAAAPEQDAARDGGSSRDVDMHLVIRVTDAAAEAGLPMSGLLTVLRALSTHAAPPAPPATTRPREIALTPLGGGTHIGGSCMLVTVGDIRILVDAGMRMKRRIDDAGPADIAAVRAGRLDAIVITHAHNDHAGYVPALTAAYPSLPVLCSPDTAALLPTMWNDSVKVFKESRSDYVEEGEPPAKPPYSQADVSAALRRTRAVDFGRAVEIADGVTIELFPAGHILGAAGVVVTAGASRVVVTGDVSDLAQATVPGLVLPPSARGADLLVIESTYCGPELTNRDAEVNKFIRTVDEHVSAGGRVLVPAFALGRAQEVALTLRHRLPNVPVLIDGMAREISRVYEQQTADAGRPLRIYGDQVRAVGRDSREQEIRTFRRGVIVTTSGMLTSGPAVQWARAILPDPDSALLIAGYQDAESPGRALLDLAEEGARGSFPLDGSDVPVRSRVAKFGLSAHADRKGLSAIIRDADPASVMLVHGVPRKQRDFAENLTRRGYAVSPTGHWQN